VGGTVPWNGMTEDIVPAPVSPLLLLTMATMMTAIMPRTIRHTKVMMSLSVAIRLQDRGQKNAGRVSKRGGNRRKKRETRSPHEDPNLLLRLLQV